MTNEMRRRVLIIAYHFPPLAGAGMLKILRTTRYLPSSGWEPFVLTVKNPEPYHRAPNPIPDGVRVFRARRIPGGNLLARALRRLKLDERWLLLPDQYLFWIPGVILQGWRIIRRYKLDLIYVTGPPYSALLAGLILKRLTGKPLVADIRDPWSFNAARKGYPTPFHRWLDGRYERAVLRGADHLTCIYRITADGYARRYPWSREKLSVFYDTVDRADLPETVTPYPQFTVTYLGTFYPPFHSLRATFQGIQTLLQEGAIDSERFRFNYVGPPDKTFENLVKEYGIETIIRWAGYQPLKEAQAEASRSHMLLLLLEFATINTKLFDYLAAGNAILAVVPDFDELQSLLERYADRYDRITDLDAAKIAESIKQCYNDYIQNGRAFSRVKHRVFLDEMNIEMETKALAGVFQNVVDMKRKHG